MDRWSLRISFRTNRRKRVNPQTRINRVNFFEKKFQKSTSLLPSVGKHERVRRFFGGAQEQDFGHRSAQLPSLQGKKIGKKIRTSFLGSFQILGEKGNFTQSSASDYDYKTNVLFQTQLSRDGVACWKDTKPLNSENFQLIIHDDEKCIFTNDIKVFKQICLRNLGNLFDGFLDRFRTQFMGTNRSNAHFHLQRTGSYSIQLLHLQISHRRSN